MIGLDLMTNNPVTGPTAHTKILENSSQKSRMWCSVFPKIYPNASMAKVTAEPRKIL